MARQGADPHDDEAAGVERAMAVLEAQRAVLGDAVVDTAIGPLRRRLDELRSGIEQRRMVTVLFADLVDFTGLSERLDAEDVRAVVDRYFDRWLRVVTAHGGEVEKFIGDAVMAVFGLRRSYEDDATRAVRSALAMLSGLHELNTALETEHGVRLAARVGVDTGDVVVSTLGDRDGAEFVVVGPTVNRAARLQAIAPVGRVLVSAETHRLVRGAFRSEPRPGLHLKGVDGTVDAHLIGARSGSGFRLERSAAVEGVATTTVGRDRPSRMLREALDRTAAERAHTVITVMGEAGVGKTRLLYDFDAELLQRDEDVWWFRGRASPVSRGSVGALLRDVVSARLGVRLDDDRELVRRRFEEVFAEALGAEDGPAAARLVAAWLRFAPPAGDVPTDPLALRDRGSAALARYFTALTRWGSVVLLLEDLHWADDESLRWLEAVAPLLDAFPVLVVGSARPDLLTARPDWGTASRHLRIELGALGRRDGRTLVRQLLSRVANPPATLVETLVDIGDGNPFYLEELVGWLVDTGVVVRDEPHWRVDEGRSGAVTVPPTLRGVLQSRLDALSARERAALQRAAVVGRVFWDAAVDSLDARAGESAESLDALTAREVVLQRDTSRFGDAREFVFKHALLRDVAYDGLLRRSRERYHRATARWLEETSARSGRAEEYASVIAGHLERARDPRAAAWYVRAAAQAAAVHAGAEAADLLDAAERTAAEDDLTTRWDIGLAREAQLGREGDRDGQRVVLEGLEPFESAVDEARRVRRLLALGELAFSRSDYDPALAAARTARELADAAARPELEAAALLLEGKARTWLDELGPARRLLEDAVNAGAAAAAPATVAEAERYLCILDGNVGEFPAALAHARAARAGFARIGDAEMEALALAQTATLFYKMGRFADAQRGLEECLPIFARSGHRVREAMARSNLAAIAVMRDDHRRALEEAEEVVPQLAELGDREASAVALTTLSVARLHTGGDAEEPLGEALAIAQDLGNAMLVTDAFARRSLVRLVRQDQAGAVADARAAVEVAAAAPSSVERATAAIALGHVLLAAADPAGALTSYEQALHAVEGLGTGGQELEARIGASAAADLLGDASAAGRMIGLLHEISDETRAGMLLPGLSIFRCAEVLDRAGDPALEEALAAAANYLATVEERLSDAELAAEFFALPHHAALRALLRERGAAIDGGAPVLPSSRS